MQSSGVLTHIQIQYANSKNMPFLALSGKHGYNVNLNKVKHGIGINMRSMNSIELAKDGKTATIGGGIVTKKLTHELWDMDKITSASLTHQLHPAL